MTKLIAVLLLLLPVEAQAAIYYISPTGNDSTGAGSSASPWKTWTKVNAVMGCGDSAILKNGTYGDGTTTGKIAVNGRTCTLASPLTIAAENQRQAMINDNGCGIAVDVLSSSGVVIDGLYVRSNDNNTTGCFDAGDGTPLRVKSSSSVIIMNSVSRNPNRYANSHGIDLLFVQNVTLEDNEIYVFHRHGVDAWQSSNVVSRRTYCNPRGGKISGGFGLDQGPVGTAGACMSMYPCQGCIEENAILDGSTTPAYLAEMNATFGSSVLMSGSKVLGSICYKCNFGNGIFPNSRNVADLNHTPQNITIKDVVFVDWASNARMIRLMDCVGCTIDHVTGLATGAINSLAGLYTEDGPYGVSASSNSLTATNIVISGIRGTGGAGTGFQLTGFNTWTLDETVSYDNTVAYNPSSDPASGSQTLSNTSTANHQLGTCKAWIPAGSPLKGAGTGGSDIGATILYRYVNGVLTTTPLWDPVTGEFPHGAITQDGVNNVAGDSLFDFHTRININTNGCSFPSGYGGSTPTNPGSRVASTDLTGAHIHVIDIGTESLTVGVMVRHDGLNVADPIAVTSSCGGESIPLLLSGLHTPANDRSQAIFGKINPTPGTCTLTPTFDDPARVSGWVMISAVENNVASYHSPVGGASLSASPNISVPTSSTERILDFISTSNAPSIAAGDDQIFTIEKAHSTVALRGASSLQLGSSGGTMSWTLGSSVGWVQQGVSLIPSGGTGSTSTFTLTKYRIDGLLGSTSTPEITLGTLAAQDTQGQISIGGAGRIRAEILIGTATSTITPLALYCRKNGGSYAVISNTFGSNDIRLYGPGVENTIPVHGSATTQRFSGTFQAGITVRDASAVSQLATIPSGTRTEVDYQVVIGNTAVHGDVFDCQIRKSGGTAFDAYTVTPSILAVGPSASMGF